MRRADSVPINQQQVNILTGFRKYVDRIKFLYIVLTRVYEMKNIATDSSYTLPLP